VELFDALSPLSCSVVCVECRLGPALGTVLLSSALSVSRSVLKDLESGVSLLSFPLFQGEVSCAADVFFSFQIVLKEFFFTSIWHVQNLRVWLWFIHDCVFILSPT